MTEPVTLLGSPPATPPATPPVAVTPPATPPVGAPEKYEAFTLPEGVKLEGAELEAVHSFAKDLGLTQEQAQKLAARDVTAQAALNKRIEDESAAAINGWADTAKTDKEFGGEKLTENLAVANRALDTFGTPELKAMLKQSGMGNHPEAIRFMYRVGKAISEDKLVKGNPPVQPKRFYSNSQHAVG